MALLAVSILVVLGLISSSVMLNLLPLLKVLVLLLIVVVVVVLL